MRSGREGDFDYNKPAVKHAGHMSNVLMHEKIQENDMVSSPNMMRYKGGSRETPTMLPVV